MKKYSLIFLATVFLGLSGSKLLGQTEDKKATSTGQEKEVKQENAEKENPFNISLDLMSRYVWRGTDYGRSPSIQPGFEYGIAGFAVGVWGAFTTNLSPVQEIDLYLNYTIKDMFTIQVTDYYFPDETNPHDYFNYDETRGTGHVFEGMLAFNGTEKVPLSVFVATNFYGGDAKRLDADSVVTGDQYSTYAEIAYTWKFISVFMGVNLTQPDTDKGEVGYYGDKIGIVNLGFTASKDIKITKTFSLPVTASLITNPVSKQIYFVAGFSF